MHDILMKPEEKWQETDLIRGFLRLCGRQGCGFIDH
jgi:hypothetical protein